MVKSGATTGNIAYVDIDDEFSIWSPLALVRCNKYHQKYVFYSMLSAYFKQQVQISWSYGTQQNIGMGVIENLHVFVSSYKNQEKIAEFLDNTIAKINSQIKKVGQIIELLREKREVTIINAVTKGLNPNAAMKDSGIEWLGQVPKHWDVKKLKYLVKLNNIKTDEESLPYIGLENVESGTGKLLNILLEEKEDVEAIKFFSGSVMLNKLRPYLTKVFISDFEGKCTSEFFVFSCNNVIFNHYLYYSMLSKKFIDHVNSSTYGAKMPRTNWNFVGQISLPYPEKKEQIAISDFLDIETKRIDILIDKNQKLIDKLKEYQEALITAAVTGQIEIRSEEQC